MATPKGSSTITSQKHTMASHILSRGQRRSVAGSSRHVWITGPWWSFRVERRALIVGGILTASCIAVSLVLLTLGDYPMSIGTAAKALVGVSSDPMAVFFVRDLRAPRVVLALAVGAALGCSGALFQSLTANPLGSPDITGFTTGAATGAIAVIILAGGSPATTGVGALVGGAATGVIVWLLARGSGLSGTRFVLIGIGVAAILQALNALMIVRASLSAAHTAAQWLAGSLNAAGWAGSLGTAAAIATLIPLAMGSSAALAVMAAGDELAIGVGVRVTAMRGLAIASGIACVAVAVGAAGPVSFVALAAPQLAKTLTKTATVGIVTSALMGALLVASADGLAQRLFAPTQLPVGVVTGVLGGLYLVWLLARRRREGL